MITEMPKNNSNELNPIPFGARLQSAREALGLESKDAADQLRLNEAIILMMEKDCYSSDLPAIFIRGYLRSYGKLLQIPEHEIKRAIEPVQPKPAPQLIEPPAKKPMLQLTSKNYLVQSFTYFIVATLIGLVGIWGYSHSTTTPTTENQLSLPIEKADATAASSTSIKTEAVAASVNLGAKLTEDAGTTLASQPAATNALTSPEAAQFKKPATIAVQTHAKVVDIDEANPDSNSDDAE